MGEPDCPGCRRLTQRVAELEALARRLEAEIRDLRAKLGVDSTNSSTPPSANPPGAPKPVVKKKSKRKRGGQPGHPHHRRPLLPVEQVGECFVYLPDACKGCGGPLECGDNDPEPTRLQTFELPRLVAEVVEHVAHACTCPSCGTVTRAALPAEVRRHAFGPRLVATVAYFTGSLGMSKSGVQETFREVFGLPICLGSVCNLEREASESLAPAHAEAVAAVKRAEVKHADETGWKRKGRTCWLWTAATTGVVAFAIHAKRSRKALAAFLGAKITGILHSDRWGVYGQVPASRRQLCWAHLKRDFQKLIDRGGEGAATGRAGGRLLKRVFAAWHEFKGEKITRAELQARLDPLEKLLNGVLVDGAMGDDARAARFCKNLLKVEPGLWTFASHAGVEPTNNFMERLLRRAVLWRRRSFGCDSMAGCRFVERILTVVGTLRLQGRNALEFLSRCIAAHRRGSAAPTLCTG